jgi:uncharacterized membrane protein
MQPGGLFQNPAAWNTAFMGTTKPGLGELSPRREPTAIRAMRWLCAASFVWVGVAHFINPDPFIAIMPPQLPAHRELVLVSGLFEVLGGVGLLVPFSRRFAAWGLLALLVAVFPANIHMAVNEIYLPDMPRERWILWARLPFQFVFAGWIWLVGLRR